MNTALNAATTVMAQADLFDIWDAFEGRSLDMIAGIGTVLAFVVFLWIGSKRNFSAGAFVVGIVVAVVIIVMSVSGGLSAIADVVVDTFSNLGA